MELIKITEENGKQLVSARELHEKLEVKSAFKDWANRRIVNNNYFAENSDFVRVLNFERAGQKALEFALTLDTAKKIAMAENTDKGNEVRNYFIECESKLKELQQHQLPQTFSQALLLAAKQAEEIERQNSEIQGLEQALDTSEQWISIIRASQEYGVKETYFNWRELKKYSIENGIAIKEAPCPRYGKKKLYHVSVFTKVYPELK